MKIGSLFSGAGGLDMAVEAVFGGSTIWHVENDPAATKVLAHRWPSIPNHGDITAVGWTRVEPVDVLCGGWPCQPFSLAGKRKGADDERALWPYVAGAIRMVRPRLVVLENVSAVLGSEFQRVANDLAACGYDIAWTCLRASDVGAPHRRERLFILATAADAASAHHGSEAWYQTGTPQAVRSAGWSGRPDSGAAAAHTDGGGFTQLAQQDGQPVESELEASQWRDSLRCGDGPPVDLLPTPRSSDCFGAGLHGDGGMDLRTTVSLLPTPNAQDGNGGGRYSSEGHQSTLPGEARLLTQWGKHEPAIRRWENLTRPAPAPTEPNKNGNPRLAAAFSQWLMGWPPGWVTDPDIGISRNHQLRIIGNGVCPQQATHALQYLLTVCGVPA